MTAFLEADKDDSIRVIVVTGAGRAFCAGADLSGGGGTFEGASESVGRAEGTSEEVDLLNGTMALATPVIAAINGPAVGAGLTLPLEWDLRVVGEDAKLGFVFNRRGMVPDAELLWLVPRMIGIGPAMDLLLTGRFFTGLEACELGLAERVVPTEEVLNCALELGQDIADNVAPASAAITKRLLYEFLEFDMRGSAWGRQRELFRWAGRQADAHEGIMSFLEHRRPHWTLSKRAACSALSQGSGRRSNPY
jgi:enoyl-CoA hydratase/carnithine racemase